MASGSTTVIFTSDALKRIRREERKSGKTPPEVAPKPPRNHPLLLHQVAIHFGHSFGGERVLGILPVAKTAGRVKANSSFFLLSSLILSRNSVTYMTRMTHYDSPDSL